MITQQNFHGLNTPQLIDTLTLTIPAVSNRMLAGQPIRERFLDKAVVGAWRQKWLVAADGSRCWQIKRLLIDKDTTEFIAANPQWVDAPLAAADESSSMFTVTDLPVLNDRHYTHCTFAQPQPWDLGGNTIPHRLFPDDDTPMIFDHCNLINALPPPGSTVIKCNTAIKESDVVLSTEDVVIDGQIVTTIEVRGSRIHGRVNEQTLSVEYFSSPRHFATRN